MPILQVALGNGATQISTSSNFAKLLLVQNNAAHPCRVADDPNVSVTTPAAVNGGTAGAGLQLQPGGSIDVGTFLARDTYLSRWYIAGTAGDIIDIVYLT